MSITEQIAAAFLAIGGFIAWLLKLGRKLGQHEERMNAYEKSSEKTELNIKGIHERIDQSITTQNETNKSVARIAGAFEQFNKNNGNN